MTSGQVVKEYQGKRGFYHHKGLSFRIIINDVRVVFSRVDVQITPESGKGLEWVSTESISVDNERGIK